MREIDFDKKAQTVKLNYKLKYEFECLIEGVEDSIKRYNSQYYESDDYFGADFSSCREVIYYMEKIVENIRPGAVSYSSSGSKSNFHRKRGLNLLTADTKITKPDGQIRLALRRKSDFFYLKRSQSSQRSTEMEKKQADTSPFEMQKSTTCPPEESSTSSSRKSIIR